jgi:hypothetical protein
VLALAALQSWANWPFVPDEITVSPDRCPPLASGGYQAEEASPPGGRRAGVGEVWASQTQTGAANHRAGPLDQPRVAGRPSVL